jgi:hypothetical protein
LSDSRRDRFKTVLSTTDLRLDISISIFWLNLLAYLSIKVIIGAIIVAEIAAAAASPVRWPLRRWSCKCSFMAISGKERRVVPP